MLCSLYALLGHGGLAQHVAFQSNASSPSSPRDLRKRHFGCTLHPGTGRERRWPGIAGLTVPQTCRVVLVGVRVSFPQIAPILAALEKQLLSTLNMVLAH